MYFNNYGGYGGYGYGGCHNSFSYYGNSMPWGGGYGYGGGCYGGGYVSQPMATTYVTTNTYYVPYRTTYQNSYFSNYGCNRMFGGYGHCHRYHGGGLLGLLFRSLDGESTDIFSTYKGEVKPVQPYAFPNEYTGGKVKGLFIGINYGGTPAELKGSCADVGVMMDTLKHIQFPLKEAAILVDDPKFAGANGVPTRENIIQHMLWLVKDAKAGDVLFFHYSGHTSNTKPLEGDVNSNGQSTPSNAIVPSDFQQSGMLADDDVYEILVRSLPEGVRMTIVMDCAEGSGFVDLPFSYIHQPAGVAKCGRKMMAEATFLKQQAVGDVVMFCGVGASNEGSGACTNALAVAFRETAGLDYIGLVESMKNTLAKHNIQQIPRLSCSKPMQLTTGFSLFGAVPADQCYYENMSDAKTVEWKGPIPYTAPEEQQKPSPDQPSLNVPYVPGQQQQQQPYIPGQ